LLVDAVAVAVVVAPEAKLVGAVIRLIVVEAMGFIITVVIVLGVVIDMPIDAVVMLETPDAMLIGGAFLVFNAEVVLVASEAVLIDLVVLIAAGAILVDTEVVLVSAMLDDAVVLSIGAIIVVVSAGAVLVVAVAVLTSTGVVIVDAVDFIITAVVLHDVMEAMLDDAGGFTVKFVSVVILDVAVALLTAAGALLVDAAGLPVEAV
jgi:hypothetical protein